MGAMGDTEQVDDNGLFQKKGKTISICAVLVVSAFNLEKLRQATQKKIASEGGLGTISVRGKPGSRSNKTNYHRPPS